MYLPWVQSFRVAAVPEDCAQRLGLLGRTMAVKMSREDGATPAQEENTLVKLARVCQFVSQQMSTLQCELQEEQSLSSLVQYFQEDQRRKEKIKRDGDVIKQRKLNLLKQQEVYDKNQKRNEMYTLWKQLKKKTVWRKTFEKKSAVLESQTLKDKASKTNDLLKLLGLQKADDRYGHQENERILHIQHEERQQVLHEWQERTKQVLQEMQTQLNGVLCKKTLNLDKLMDKRRKAKEMQRVVMEEKEEQEQLRQQEEKAAAATKLQAWWRGCMVRRGLGAFEKTETEKKDKKKKKKKGKKKK